MKKRKGKWIKRPTKPNLRLAGEIVHLHLAVCERKDGHGPVLVADGVGCMNSIREIDAKGGLGLARIPKLCPTTTKEERWLP